PAGQSCVFSEVPNITNINYWEDHVTGIFFTFDLLGFRHHTSRPAPAGIGLVSKLGKYPCGLAGLAIQRGRLLHLYVEDAPQALVARKAEYIIDLMGFTPTHQRLAAESGIGAQNDF